MFSRGQSVQGASKEKQIELPVSKLLKLSKSIQDKMQSDENTLTALIKNEDIVSDAFYKIAIEIDELINYEIENKLEVLILKLIIN